MDLRRWKRASPLVAGIVGEHISQHWVADAGEIVHPQIKTPGKELALKILHTFANPPVGLAGGPSPTDDLSGKCQS